MRLDKLLAHMGYGTRKQVKQLMKKSHVTVNEERVKDGKVQINPKCDHVSVNQAVVEYQKYIYLLLNKPQGYLSATEDSRDRTVMDLLDSNERHFNPFPVGRLDKDTEGLLLLTNHGQLAHQLLSPKKEIEKTYFAQVKGKVTEQDVRAFQQGVLLDDDYQTKPAKLTILTQGAISDIELTITEGKFHQVKRMFASVAKEVIYLKRVRMGQIKLDGHLAIGESRELNEVELAYCLSLIPDELT